MATLHHCLYPPFSYNYASFIIPSPPKLQTTLKYSHVIRRGLKVTPISTISPSLFSSLSGRAVCGAQHAAVQGSYYWEDQESMCNKVGEGKLVCVTGASGFIASWIVKFLLQRGYTVKGTVRDPSDPRKVDHLLNLEGAKERLQLIKADLQEEGSFDEAVEGCEGVFHTASPCYFDPIDPQTELIDPAVNGTLNVLRSCAKSSNVKRVVLTSSFAAVSHTGIPLTSEIVVDETWFSSPDICRQKKRWYHVSKILAEDAAWKFAKENSLDLVALNPAFVIGTLLQPSLNETCAVIFNLIKGQTYPNYSAGWVNVKDVAYAHIQAFEIPSATGRYILIERIEHYSEHLKILRQLFPTLPLPEKCADDKPPMSKYQVSKEKAKSLGIEFIPLEVSLKETVESFKEKNFINF